MALASSQEVRVDAQTLASPFTEHQQGPEMGFFLKPISWVENHEKLLNLKQKNANSNILNEIRKPSVFLHHYVDSFCTFTPLKLARPALVLEYMACLPVENDENKLMKNDHWTDSLRTRW